jgi:putative endonuclease
MFYCYVVRSQKTGRRYVGSCEELDEHLRRHNAQESKATKHGVPWTLVHYEIFSARSEALNRERYCKTGRGRDELDRLEFERSPRRQVAGSNPVTPTTFRGQRSEVRRSEAEDGE